MASGSDTDYKVNTFILKIVKTKANYRDILEICREPANIAIIYYSTHKLGRRNLWNIMAKLVNAKLVEVYSNHPYTWKTTPRGLRLLQKRPAEGNILQYILKGD